MIIDRLAKRASKSPGPEESKPRERIEPLSMSFNAICSQKAHQHSFPVSTHSIQFSPQLNVTTNNGGKREKRGNGSLLCRGDRDPQIRRILPSHSARENPTHRDETR